jgi:hypothetical protein
VSTNPGQLLRITTGVFFARFQDLLVISILATAISSGLQWLSLETLLGEEEKLISYVLDADGQPESMSVNGAALVALLVVTGLSLAMWVIPVSLITIGELTGRPTDLITAMAAIPSRLGRVFLVQMAWSLAIFLGMVLFFIPGIYVMIRFWVVPVVAVIEGLGEFRAFVRAGELTEGSRVAYLMILIPGVGAMFLLGPIVTGLFSSLGFTALFTALMGSLVLQLVFTTGLFVLQTVSYHQSVAAPGGVVRRRPDLDEDED